MKKISLIFGLIIGCQFASMAHGGGHDVNDMVYKAERLWMEQGILTVLSELESSGKLTEHEFSMFLFHNRNRMVQLQAGYFDLIDELKKSHTEFHSLETYVQNQKKEVLNIFDKFLVDIRRDEMLKTEILEGMKVSEAAAIQAGVTGCANANFENPGPDSIQNWQAYLGVACYHRKGVTNYACNKFASTPYLTASAANRIRVENGALRYDPIVGGTNLPVNYPYSGNNSVRIENFKNGSMASQMAYNFIVDVNQPAFEYHYAVVLEDPGISHPDSAKPYFSVSIYDNTTSSFIDCAGYEVFANSEDKNPMNDFLSKSFKQIPGTSFHYKNWTDAVIPLNDYVGHDLTIMFTASDCPWGGHLGYAYIDATCFNGTITAVPCQQPDGTRELTGPAKYKSYLWRGSDVISDNEGQKVIVRGKGPFICQVTAESSCSTNLTISVDSCPQPVITPCTIMFNGAVGVVGCDANTNTYSINFQLTHTNLPNYARILITDGRIHQTFLAPFNSPHNFTIKDLYADGQTHTLKAYLFKDDFMAFEYALCYDDITYDAPDVCFVPVIEMYCDNCIGSFAPTPGRTYVVSAWAREPGAAPTLTTYTNPVIEISYPFSPHPVVTATVSGKIIDGWQRIYQEFTVPGPLPGPPATKIEVKLRSLTGTSDFDDIRIFPIDGNMKSYVYDPVSLRLVATLDENNYASFYEYDQEGNLTRTKKETERGIVTISENRQSNKKQ